MTRHDPNDIPETQIVALLRGLFGEDVLKATAWKSTAIANAVLTKQSLYEIDRTAVGRAAYVRALESVDAVNAEIVDLVKKVWADEQAIRHHSLAISQLHGHPVVS